MIFTRILYMMFIEVYIYKKCFKKYYLTYTIYTFIQLQDTHALQYIIFYTLTSSSLTELITNILYAYTGHNREFVKYILK